MNKRAIVAIAAAFLCGLAPLAAQEAPTTPTPGKDGSSMRIILSSVFVNDQEKALEFYTEVLGFVKKQDVPVGEFRWLTVVSPADPDGTELLLEPNDNPAAKTYQEAIFEQGIPSAMFGVDDVAAEYERLKERGVVFRSSPTQMGPVTIAVLEDTCGNLIQIAEKSEDGPRSEG